MSVSTAVEFLASHQPAWHFQQQQKNLDRLALQSDQATVFEQLAGFRINFEFAKANSLGRS